MSYRSTQPAMVDYLIHFYRKGSPPFRSLSLLPEESALSIMRRLYIKGSAFWERFSDPCGYLAERKKVETALYEGFVGKGGAPRTRHPLYLVLGRPKWTERVADPATLATSDELLVPLRIIPRDVISFTYPDSMVSAFMVEQKKPEYYEPEYHGKVFTLDEIREILERKGMPGEGWETKMPVHLAHYIEAQVWDHAVLQEFARQRRHAHEQ